MTLLQFLRLAQEFANFGWSIQEQLQDVVNGRALEEQNPVALRDYHLPFLQRLVDLEVADAEEVLDDIRAYLEEL